MMYEGKHIHYSPVDNKPLCSYSTKLCKQRRLNGYAFCIRHILEDKSAPFKQCAHVAKYNNQKCTNPIPTNEDREYCNSHMQVAGMAPKKERKAKKEKESNAVCSPDGKIKFADRLKALLNKTGHEVSNADEHADDPYAFSECVGEVDASPSAVSSPKEHSESNNRQSKNGGNKSSKTMNRLQAKIAHNKVLDKLKKSQDCSVNSVKNEVAIHSNGVLQRVLLHSSAPKSTDSLETVKMPTKKMWCRLKSDTKEIAEPLQRVRESWEERRMREADLHPLGLEMSDSESDDGESVESIQRHWFYTWDKGDTLQVNSQFLPNSRPARLSVRRAEMRRQLNQMCDAQTASVAHRDFQQKFVSALLRSTKRFPNRTAELVENIHTNKSETNVKINNNNKSKKMIGVVKRFCCYKNDKTTCNSIALPHTRHCIKHIMYNVDQLLFEHCTAKFADNTQCCIPVFDICHELPLCTEHARKRDNYNKMSAEPKPKKPRKKTKPSALTRPPKRGKKKKRQNGIRPNKQSAHVSALNSIAASTTDVSSSISLGLDSSPGPTELNADDISKGLEDNLDDDLEDHLSPGSIEKSLELPLDTAELANQASRLLEEHDFTEVLNKIPDDAFNDLFSESKNGDFLPTKEETEELERALAAVDKDVKSLEKLSADGSEMSDLAGISMRQIHDSLLQSDDLAPSMDNLNVMTSSFTTNDLNSLSQVLSTITTDSMVHNPMPVDSTLLLPELVQGQLQLQVPVSGAHQTANFVLGPQLLGAAATAQFPIPLAAPDQISISLQSQFRAGQWILSPADQTFAPMVYQNGFPVTTQPLTAGQVMKFPFASTAVDGVKPNDAEVALTMNGDSPKS